MKLTDALIKRRLPAIERVELADSDVPGLRIRLSGKHGQWSYMGRVAGQRKRAALGDWPGLTTAQACERAREVRQQMKDGIDPTETKRAAEREAAERQTVADLMEPYFATLTGVPKHVSNEIHNTRHAVLEAGIGALTPDELTIAHARKLTGLHKDRPATARHRFGAFSRFCDFLVEEEVIQVNPLHLLPKRKRPGSPIPRSRVLTAAELQAIWKAAGDAPEPFARFIRFLILVPLRRGEAARIESSWIKDGVLTLPHMVTKNNDRFEIPLPEATLDLIGNREGLVFASQRTGGPVGGLGRIARQLREPSGVDGWSLHDFRRTFTTQMAEAGVAMDVTDGLLNHRQGETRAGVRGVYNRSKLRGPRTRAMRAWGDMVQRAIETGTFEGTAEVHRIA